MQIMQQASLQRGRAPPPANQLGKWKSRTVHGLIFVPCASQGFLSSGVPVRQFMEFVAVAVGFLGVGG